jgi:hypothetical protein
MEQHPIPQQISSYEFKLVGEMTLKQFLKAAGGIIIALLINSSGLLFFIKWPLMLVFGAGGLALAFVPFQDRPLETWVLSFIKSIYSPTIYTYKRTGDGSVSVKPTVEIKGDIKGEKGLAEEEKEEEVKVRKKEEKKVFEFIGTLPSVKREEKHKETKPSMPILEPDPIEPVVEKKVEVAPKKEESVDESWRDSEANLNLKTEKLGATGKALFGEIPMPNIPDVPNMIVGMVTSPEGKIVEGAIVEIQDESGNPSRVLKTNQLGQFKSSTQLANGRYLIITEKENFGFDRVNIDLTGGIVQPVKIIAKTKVIQ